MPIHYPPTPAVRRICLVLLALPALATFPVFSAWAQAAPDPIQLVRDTAWNELHAGGDGHPFRYRTHTLENGKSTVKEIYEARGGGVSRLIESGGKPLDAKTDAKERSRLETLRSDPSEWAAKQKKAKADDKRENEMVSLLPTAFLYTSLGVANGPNGPCYRLQFKPNPAFTPPDREAEVYHGMAGELWIDQAQKRVVRLEAHLIADVDFGWGIAGRLYQGGAILVEDRDVGDHHWETVHERLHIQGKILLIKQLTIDETDDSTDFAPVPDDGYKAAIAQLLAMPVQ